MTRRALLPIALLFIAAATGCGAADVVTSGAGADVASYRSASDGSNVIYFGQLEVHSGQLKSADGGLPRAGGTANLRLFLPELASFLCREYCMALYPQLFVRYRDDQAFQEVPGIPQGGYNMRGPQSYWAQEVADVALSVPADAERVEVYMNFGRLSWNGATCYLAYDMMECPDSFPISGAYLSNYGHNFAIGVQR